MIDDVSSENFDIIGHKNIIDFLRTSVKNDRLAHAYLFFGPHGVGRKKVARNFILSLFCENENKPCLRCRSCSQIIKNIHPDISKLKRDTEKKNISVEQVRELLERLSMGSFLNSYKIAVIEGAEDLSAGAANALLKTLEEPTPKTILILISNSLNSFPETIRSRCQVIKFLPVAEREIFDYLKNRGLSRSEAEDLAHLAFGRPGIAVNFLENKNLFAEYKEQVEEFIKLAGGDITERFKIINEIASIKYDKGDMVPRLTAKLEIWSVILRDLLFINLDNVEFISNRFISSRLEQLAKSYTPEKLLELLKDIKKTGEYLRQNVNPKLSLENFALNL